MYYNARWYDPALRRFAQADSIVPPGVQGLDRYAYTFNNPIRYTDPTGHFSNCSDNGDYCVAGSMSSEDSFQITYGVKFTGGWNKRDKSIAKDAVKDIAAQTLKTINDYCGKLSSMGESCSNTFTAGSAFRAAFDSSSTNPVILEWGNCPECNGAGGYTYSSHHIAFASLADPTTDGGGYKTPAMAYREAVNNVVHEFGHAFALQWNKNGVYGNSGPYADGIIPEDMIDNDGFYLYPQPDGASKTWRQHPCTSDVSLCSHEVYADMYLGWVYGSWAPNQAGVDRAIFMNQNMNIWIVDLVSP